MDSVHVQTLWQIMEQLRDADQLESALSGSLDILCGATDSPKGSIWMKDDQSGSLIAVTASGTTDATGESARNGEGLIGQVSGSGESAVMNAADVRNIRLAGTDSPAVSGINLMCVPVKTPKHIIGCLLLTGKETDYTEDDKSIHIMAVIYVERDSQKGIIIGHQGKKLKHVGIEARKDIEKFFEKRVFLELFVKVEKDWRNQENKLRQFGYIE